MMPVPGGELILSLALQAIISLVVWAVKAAWRALRCCVFDHPLLTLFTLQAFTELGWWVPLLGTTVDLWMTVYRHEITLGLSSVAIAKFVAGGGPAAVARDIRGAGRWAKDAATAITAAEWAVARRDENEANGKRRRRIWSWGHTKDGGPDAANPLPPPPQPTPGGPAGGGQVIDVREVPVNGHGSAAPQGSEPVEVKP